MRLQYFYSAHTRQDGSSCKRKAPAAWAAATALTHATALHKLSVQYYLPKGGAQIQRAAFGAENAPALIIKGPPAINATEAL